MPRFHRQPLPRLWCLALAFLLVAGSLFAPSPPLYTQDPDVADAPGSISGRVTDAAGLPLTGIRVTLDSQGDHVYRSPIFTNQDGQYAFTFLGAGIYKIGFSDPNAVYGAEFYPGAARLAEAASIPVTGNDITGVDAHLVGGGVITGTLTFATSAPRNWALEITLWRYDRDLGLQMERRPLLRSHTNPHRGLHRCVPGQTGLSNADHGPVATLSDGASGLGLGAELPTAARRRPSRL